MSNEIKQRALGAFRDTLWETMIGIAGVTFGFMVLSALHFVVPYPNALYWVYYTIFIIVVSIADICTDVRIEKLKCCYMIEFTGVMMELKWSIVFIMCLGFVGLTWFSTSGLLVAIVATALMLPFFLWRLIRAYRKLIKSYELMLTLR